MVDDCGICDDDPANDNLACIQDCAGVWGGGAVEDQCGQQRAVIGGLGSPRHRQHCAVDDSVVRQQPGAVGERRRRRGRRWARRRAGRRAGRSARPPAPSRPVSRGWSARFAVGLGERPSSALTSLTRSERCSANRGRARTSRRSCLALRQELRRSSSDASASVTPDSILGAVVHVSQSR